MPVLRCALRFAVLPLVALFISVVSSQSDALAAGPITNGQNVTGTLVGGQVDVWTLTATPGNVVTVTASEVGLNTAFVPRIDVIAPNGVTDVAADGNDVFAIVQFTAQSSGTYSIRVQQNFSNGPGGTYLLTVAQSATAFVVPVGDEGGPISSGQNMPGTIARGDLDQWSFTAHAGQVITVSASEVGPNSSFVPHVDVFGPNGSPLAGDGNGVFAIVQFTAPADGTYIILVRQHFQSDLTATYLLTLAQSAAPFAVPAGDEGGPIDNGQTVTGTIFRGDLDQWSFCAAKGHSIEVTVTDIGTDKAFVPRITVYGPNGSAVASNANDVAAAVTFPAPSDGAYVILVAQAFQSDLTGGYSLEMVGGTACSLPPIVGPVASLPMPIRVIDTRTLGSGPIAAGQSRCFDVAGVAGIPLDAGAVVMNVTAVGYGTNGWLTVYPNGQSVPATSTLNFDTHEYAMANGAIMRIGSNGQVCVNVGTVGGLPGSAHVVLDATGYLTADDLVLLPMLTQPQRVVDTRTSGAPVAAGQSRCFTMAGVMGVPGDAAAVVLNVTAVGYGLQGWLTAYPNGQSLPDTSTLNFDTTEYAIANGSIVRIGDGGQVCVNVGTVGNAADNSHIVLDVTGYLTTAGLAQMPMLTSPQRLADTRSAGGPVAAGQSRCFSLAGVGAVPAGASAVIINLTAVGYGRQGWLTAYPAGDALPSTSTLNFDTTEYAMANGAVMAIGSGGKVCVNVGTVGSAPGSSHIIIDVVGYI